MWSSSISNRTARARQGDRPVPQAIIIQGTKTPEPSGWLDYIRPRQGGSGTALRPRTSCIGVDDWQHDPPYPGTTPAGCSELGRCERSARCGGRTGRIDRSPRTGSPMGRRRGGRHRARLGARRRNDLVSSVIEPSADDIAAVWSTLNCVTVLDAIGALAKAAFAAEPIEHSADVTKVAIGVDTNVVLRLSDKARTDIVDYLGNRTDAPLIFPARSSKNSGNSRLSAIETHAESRTGEVPRPIGCCEPARAGVRNVLEGFSGATRYLCFRILLCARLVSSRAASSGGQTYRQRRLPPTFQGRSLLALLRSETERGPHPGSRIREVMETSTFGLTSS